MIEEEPPRILLVVKRRPELRRLSEDHHHALALAHRCESVARARKPHEVERSWDEAVQALSAQLEPHFQIEERILLPALEAMDESEMAERIRSEHAEMRHLLSHEYASATRLRVFAELLARHVRYEEREVFERTEARLPARVLGALAAAYSQAERGTAGRFDAARRLPFAEALGGVPGPAGERFREVFRHGSLQVEVYAPRGTDPQTPHTRDEVYVVIRGRGQYVSDGGRQPFGPGDLLFAPAGVEHRFEDFTEDLAVWVLFYGPEGGEKP